MELSSSFERVISNKQCDFENQYLNVNEKPNQEKPFGNLFVKTEVLTFLFDFPLVHISLQ